MRASRPFRFAARTRQSGGLLWRLLVVLAAGALGWAWWRGGSTEKVIARMGPVPATTLTAQASPPERADSPRPITTSQASPVVAPDGSLIVPATSEDGRPSEPRVFVPITVQRPKPAEPGTNAMSAKVLTNAASVTAVSNPPSLFNDRVLTAQVALAWRGISSGPIDAMLGLQTRAALRAFQDREKIPATGKLDAATEAKLISDTPVFSSYVVSEEDIARLLPVGKTWLAKSEQPRLDYENVIELVAEKTHSNPKLLRWLNPEIDWNNLTAGASLKIVNAEYPAPARKAAFLRIHLGERLLRAFDENTNLLAQFPCSIAARVEKRPLGEVLHISVIAPNPNYTFDPAVFPESAEAQQLGRKLILQPGPNNPVGTVWLGLDKPGYGIHGTPRPEEVGRTESHGCFRLANWNAEYLLKLVTVGTPVSVEP